MLHYKHSELLAFADHIQEKTDHIVETQITAFKNKDCNYKIRRGTKSSAVLSTDNDRNLTIGDFNFPENFGTQEKVDEISLIAKQAIRFLIDEQEPIADNFNTKANAQVKLDLPNEHPEQLSKQFSYRMAKFTPSTR